MEREEIWYIHIIRLHGKETSEPYWTKKSAKKDTKRILLEQNDDENPIEKIWVDKSEFIYM